MIYAEIELKGKVDCRTILIRNKENRIEYAKADIFDNFSFFWQNVGVGPAFDARGVNQNTLRSTNSVWDKDSMEKIIFLKKNKSRSKDE